MSNFFKKLINNKQKNNTKIQEKANKDKLENNDTENNKKNGRIAIFLSLLSCILYILALMLIVSTFRDNILLGILSIFLIPLVTIIQKKAVYHAEVQREINGKGFFIIIFAKYFVPIFALLAILGLIFGIGLLV